MDMPTIREFIEKLLGRGGPKCGQAVSEEGSGDPSKEG